MKNRKIWKNIDVAKGQEAVRSSKFSQCWRLLLAGVECEYYEKGGVPIRGSDGVCEQLFHHIHCNQLRARQGVKSVHGAGRHH